METPYYIKNLKFGNFLLFAPLLFLLVALLWLVPGLESVDTFHSIHYRSEGASNFIWAPLLATVFYGKLLPFGFLATFLISFYLQKVFSIPSGVWKFRFYLLIFSCFSFFVPRFLFGIWLNESFSLIGIISSVIGFFTLASTFLPSKLYQQLFVAPVQVLRKVAQELFSARPLETPIQLKSNISSFPPVQQEENRTRTKKSVPHIHSSLEVPVVSFVEEPQGEQAFEVADIPILATSEKKLSSKSVAEIQDYESMLDCLQAPKKPYEGPTQKYFYEISQKIQDKLGEFKITANIINILKGPVVDTFELELGPGIKVSKINSVQEDLGLALSGAPLRVVYPLKGRSTVGLEVPRNPRELIYLEDILKTDQFRNTKWRLPIAMGLDTLGNVTVIDLASMPHMLVAGSTGSGKSVFVNTLLVSLLMKCSSDYMRLLLIDPKQLELAPYAKVPHLLMPVVIESSMAAISLLWCCQEMERRYSLMRELGVRNLEGYNSKVKDELNGDQIKRIYPHLNNQEKETQNYALPFIVVVIDEFADLILSKNGKDIENNVCRLAAKARAAGIHLVLATQRPSVDVITGLIKSNFPTRVSFRVVSGIDSRTILSSTGAEKLLGMGDMLYRYGVETERMHAAYISENEIEKLVDLIAVDRLEFNMDLIELTEKMQDSQGEDGQYHVGGMGSDSAGRSAEDELYEQGVRVVVEMRAASASMLQRRLRIGYNRAANLIEEMERKGVVGPQEGSRPRKVLI
jgi:S-DNA-T family DNA segregation ATPase FtsK/SpoIIIE